MARLMSVWVALATLVLGTAAVANAEKAIAVSDLRCEYRRDPTGIDAAQPRLSWVLQSEQRGQRQTAYRVLVASSPELLARNTGDLWDSGKVESEDSIQIAYAGKSLSSGQECFWKAMVWDREGRESDWSLPARWAMGLLRSEDWKAKWIAAPRGDAPATSPAKGAAEKPLPCFRSDFTVAKAVRRATLYICGLGQFEAHLNGKRVGEDLLQPGWTDYRKTCLYVTYDVTPLLTRGANALGVMLGNGMYHVPNVPGRFAKFKGSFGEPVLIAQLDIEYGDGSHQLVTTDGSWKTAPGPITFSSTYGGEDYDARREQQGWDRAGFDDGKWEPAVERQGPGGRLRGSTASAPAVRVAAVLTTQKVTEPKPGVWVYDLGQNCALMPRVTVRGPAGSTVQITPGELLGEDGTVQQQWSKRGLCYFSYTLRGEGEETWSPRFTYYGSRYMQVEFMEKAAEGGGSPAPKVVKVEGLFVTASPDGGGSFACSNPLFDRTAELIDWAIRSNTVSILTDCPHREKLGWLEQDHLMGPSLMYDEFVPALLEKICNDMADAQTADGLVPNIAPEYTQFKGAFRDSPEWGSAAVLVPWQVYQWYGDSRVLATHYETMKRYVEYLGSQSKGGILSNGLGDWYDLGPGKMGPAQLTPVPLTATAFYYHDIRVLEKAARVLGRADDAAKYTKLAGSVAEAFNRAFYDPGLHQYATGSQAANAIPLVFGLVPETDRPAVVSNIVQDVRKHENSLTAGDVGYRYLLRALAEGGRSDVIFDMNSRSDRPGYGYIISKGATAMTEAWNARAGASQDHFMLGHILEWFYADVAGIQQDDQVPGWRRVRIRPTVVGDLIWANARYPSIRGPISSEWRREDGKFKLEVGVPPGVTAMVYVPARSADEVHEGKSPAKEAKSVKFVKMDGPTAVFEVESGKYSFSAPDIAP